MLGLAVVFMGGHSAFGADFTWDGDGGDALWSNANNWTTTGGSGVPDDSADNATLADVSPGPNCTFDLGSATTVNNVTITGNSPTRMKLNVSSSALTVNGTLSLDDYSEVAVNQNLTVASGSTTTMAGLVVLGLATGKTFTARDVLIGGPTTTVDFTTNGTSVFKVESIKADANAANAQRAVKLDGGTITLSDVDGQIVIKSDLDTDNQRAKLWVTSGTTVDWECDGTLDFIGGTTSARRVEVDIDENLDTTTGNYVLTSVTGQVDVDIAADKVFNAGQLTLTGPNTRLSVVTGNSNAKLTTTIPVGGCL